MVCSFLAKAKFTSAVAAQSNRPRRHSNDEAASVGGLFLFDFDFVAGAVSDLKSHHQHFQPINPPGSAARALPAELQPRRLFIEL
jgi:hypothetical protein